jgi:hypothetical protein
VDVRLGGHARAAERVRQHMALAMRGCLLLADEPLISQVLSHRVIARQPVQDLLPVEIGARIADVGQDKVVVKAPGGDQRGAETA